jgi:hypothetical protein
MQRHSATAPLIEHGTTLMSWLVSHLDQKVAVDQRLLRYVVLPPLRTYPGHSPHYEERDKGSDCDTADGHVNRAEEQALEDQQAPLDAIERVLGEAVVVVMYKDGLLAACSIGRGRTQKPLEVGRIPHLVQERQGGQQQQQSQQQQQQQQQ